MAFDGVFAFQGKDHITAPQLGRIVEGVAGCGRYVLPTLNEMAATMQTANKVRIATGDLVMDGRVVTNEAAVDLTVESGVSGYKRNDLVVCSYARDASTGVETFEAKVVKGTQTTGTAADPDIDEGDISSGSSSAAMPLWRIPIDGITPGTPVRIAPVTSSLSDLRDSVSQLEKAAPTVKMAAGSSVITVSNNSLWDLMSFDAAAQHLGCSVSDLKGNGTSSKLSCLVTNGDIDVQTFPALHAEMDNARKHIRVEFGRVVSGLVRINWVLFLNRA